MVGRHVQLAPDRTDVATILLLPSMSCVGHLWIPLREGLISGRPQKADRMGHYIRLHLVPPDPSPLLTLLQAYYFCYSLLTLANVVVGTEAVPLRQQGHLQQLCALLQQHVSAGIREDPCLMYRTELKDLAAKTYIKWQELLSQGWLHSCPQQSAWKE
uniref:Protein FAM178B n=1 Tax=Varanus komodoensis TaxID=61221 RepID=A0A8D2JC72_VARKO